MPGIGGQSSAEQMFRTAQAEDSMTNQQQAAVRTLERMLDYAMLEGAELRNPLFVLLLRLARLALLDELDDAKSRGARIQKGSRPGADQGSGALVSDQTP